MTDPITGFTASDLLTSITSGVTTVLPYVGAGVTGGFSLMFIFLGIRKGLGFFRSVAH